MTWQLQLQGKSSNVDGRPCASIARSSNVFFFCY
jgi:hypothetical protein